MIGQLLQASAGAAALEAEECVIVTVHYRFNEKIPENRSILLGTLLKRRAILSPPEIKL